VSPSRRFDETTGIRMHGAEDVERPLVVLCHGFAEPWYSYIARGGVDQLAVFTQQIGPNNSRVFFQEPGAAEAVLESDTRGSVRSILISAYGVAAEVNALGDGGDGILFTGMEGAPPPNLLSGEFLAGLTG
jgi:hypothetical protein